MQNKLQELTDKLYNEGLSKGKQEAEELRANAKTEAATIISNAKSEAKKILEKAEKDVAELKSKVENDLKMASSQTISSIKQQVESLIISKVISSPIKENLSEKEFLKTLITTVVKAFNVGSAEPVSLEVLLPAATQSSVDAFIEKEISKELGKGVTVQYTKQISGGFNIGPKGGSYMISFSDDSFEKLFTEYLRPSTKKFLFG